MAKAFFAFIAVFALVALFAGCSTDTRYPWKEPIGPNTTGGGGDDSDLVTGLYSLHASLPSSGQKQGSMALVPAADSTYQKAGDTNTYHATTGFADKDSDMAFISRSFWMDTVEVSRREWLRVMADVTDTLPLDWPRTGVNWFDAIRYCMKRTALEGRTQVYDTAGWKPDGYPFTPPAVNWDADGYRLPSEDEWEYAARAGMAFRYPTSDGNLDSSRANYQGRCDTSASAMVFNILCSADSVWYRLTPQVIYYDHISRHGDTLHDTVNYRSKIPTTKYIEYSYTLVKYLDTTLILDSSFIDTTIQKDSSWPRRLDPPDDNVVYFDSSYTTYLIYYKFQGNDTLYDTLIEKIESKVNYHTETDTIRFPRNTLINQIDSIDNIDPAILVDSLQDGDSFFVFRATRIDTTGITGSYLWAGLRNVGSYPPNPYGLRDLSGNAFEWCWDASSGKESESGGRGTRADYRGAGGITRMRRGGDYLSAEFYLRSEGRDGACAVNPLTNAGFTGFRTVRKAP